MKIKGKKKIEGKKTTVTTTLPCGCAQCSSVVVEVIDQD